MATSLSGRVRSWGEHWVQQDYGNSPAGGGHTRIFLGASLLFCILLAVYTNIYQSTDVVYTHLFYIPIILAGVWYPRYAIPVALFLGVLHIASAWFSAGAATGAPFIRAFMFLVLAVISHTVSRQGFMLAELLKDNEREMREITENMKDLVLRIDDRGIIEYISPSVNIILNYTQEQLLGKTIKSMVCNKDINEVNNILNNIKNKLELTEYEFRLQRSGSEFLWVEATGRLIRENGAVHGAVLAFRDISERKKAQESLSYQLEFETLVSGISTRFLNAPPGRLDQDIDCALKEVGEFFAVDRSYLVQVSADGDKASNTHEWCAEGIKPMRHRMQEIPVDTFSCMYQRLRAHDHVHIPDVEQLPPECAAEQREYRAQSIRSLLVFPVRRQGQLAGLFGFDSVRDKKSWPPEEILLLKVVSELLANSLTRHLHQEEIRYMRFHDQLTGLYNRYFLEEEMERLKSPRQLPLSVIMADLNGLKLVNDTYGHATGDELLRAAAGILNRSCRREDIVARWGGDEFLILLPRTSREEALALAWRIEENCGQAVVEDVPLSMALGVGTRSVDSEGLDRTLRAAEDDMYKQKLTESRSTRSAVLQALLRTLAEKSWETEVHTRRMQDAALKIGERLRLPVAELNRLRLSITLHDIGKINMAEEILNKPGPLTPDEWAVMKGHPEVGYRIARATEDFAHVAPEILSHHERWDGTGYPQGLRGEDIPLLARITAVADAWEVMSHGRPHQPAKSAPEIADEFRRGSGTQFDPELVEVLIAVMGWQRQERTEPGNGYRRIDTDQ